MPSWFSKVQGIGQGRDNTRQFLLDHQEALHEIREELLAQAVIGGRRAEKATALAAVPAGDPREDDDLPQAA